MQKHKPGFTIVELLIVIVVIAILAAITVVAYNGITTKAENTKTVNSVAEYVKVLTAYGAEKGNYPLSVNDRACFGPAGTVCANTSNNGNICFDSVVNYNSSFVDAINVIATSIPAPSTQTMACSNDAGQTGYYGGAYYVAGFDRIIYFLKGNQECSLAGLTLSSRQQKDDVTRCAIQLPAL